MSGADRLMGAALMLLAALFGWGFRDNLPVQLFAALPPLMLAIGLALTLIHLVSIPVSNTSVNPARSLGVAWFAGAPALVQVWAFIVAPIVGALIAGLSYAALTGDRGEVAEREPIQREATEG